MKVEIETKFTAYFEGGNKVYSWKDFKTFGGAYRYCKRQMSSYWFREAHRLTGWAVVRSKQWTDEANRYRASAVILAQYNFTRHDGYRFRG